MIRRNTEQYTRLDAEIVADALAAIGNLHDPTARWEALQRADDWTAAMFRAASRRLGTAPDMGDYIAASCLSAMVQGAIEVERPRRWRP